MIDSPERPFALVHSNGECVRGLIHETHRSPVGIYIPGFASNMQGNKALFLAQMAQDRGRGWIRFDPRGTGISDGIFAELTLTRCLADIRLLLNMIAPRPALLVGSSMGGWLSVLAASRWPDQIKAMVLIAPSFNFIRRIYEGLPAAQQAQWMERGEFNYPDRYGGGEFRLKFDFVRDAWRYDCLRWPPTLQCPVHVLHGDADEAVPISVSETFVKSYRGPHIGLQVLPGVDHRLSGAETVLMNAVDLMWPKEKDAYV